MTVNERKGLACWAQFRFSIIGGLLANPPERGELRRELERLAQQRYRHPTEDKWITFSVSTIERWYYKAVNSSDVIRITESGQKRRIKVGQNRQKTDGYVPVF